MVNQELVELCRTVVAAIQEADTFEAPQLRRLLLHIVPQLLTEIDILGGALENLLKRKPVVIDEPEPLQIVPDEARTAPVPQSSRPRGHKKTAKRRKSRARRK